MAASVHGCVSGTRRGRGRAGVGAAGAFVRVCETFTSIQGESTWAGLPCFFIRLAGCNLRCSYCDTPRALAAGRRVGVGRLVERAAVSPAPLVEITGGEPLLQESFRALAAGLRDGTNKRVLVETNGSMDISAVPAGVVAVVDVKCPGSGEGGSFDPGNLGRLRRYDELKFVISDRRDFEWAAAFVRRNGLPGACAAVLFSPAAGRLDPARLARWIVRGGVAARLQVPLHRVLGLK